MENGISIDSVTNDITKRVINLGDTLKNFNGENKVLRGVLGISPDIQITEDVIKSLEGKIITIPSQEASDDGKSS